MKFNTKYILPGDDKNEIISKINYNFQQVFFNGLGAKGPIGLAGEEGIIGQVGNDGEPGATGQPASSWFFSPSQNLILNPQDGDIWVDTGPTGGQNVYTYSSGWIYSGYSILDDSIFSLVTEINGPGSTNDKNAVVFAGNGPSGSTLVLSDVFATGAANPNFSKLNISTNAENSIFPSIGLDKTFYTGPYFPSFQWESTGNNYNLIFSSPADLKISAGATATFGSTGSSGAFFYGQTDVRLTSGREFSFVNATGASAAMSLQAQNILMNSGNKNLSGNLLSYSGLSFPIFLSGTGSWAVTTVNTSQIGNGLRVELPDSTNESGYPITTFFNSTTVYKIFESRTNNFNVIGQSGPSGSSSGFLTKTVQVQNKVNPSATFVRGLFTNNYLPLPLIGTSADVIYINALWPPPSTPQADGRNYFVYLQLSDFNGIWESAELEGRTFDVYLNDDVLCFGGIRTVYPGLSGVTASTVQINSLGNGLTGGCRHIRLEFITDRNIYYKAFTTSDPRCGFIPYSLTSTSVGPTPNL
jgi:hypothetical protein